MKSISNMLYWQKPKDSKVIKLIEIIFIMVIASLTYPTTTRAGNVSHISGPEVFAAFSSFESGCIETDVDLDIADQKVQNPPGPGTSAPAVFFFQIIKFDNCTQEQLLSASCFPQTTINFQVAKKLDSATFSTTLGCFDFVSGSSFNVSANLTWIATGAPTTQHFSNRFFFPGCKMNSHFDGTFTPAQASGTVSDGTTDFTPDPTNFADISSVKSGEADVGCPIPTPIPPSPAP